MINNNNAIYGDTIKEMSTISKAVRMLKNEKTIPDKEMNSIILSNGLTMYGKELLNNYIKDNPGDVSGQSNNTDVNNLIQLSVEVEQKKKEFHGITPAIPYIDISLYNIDANNTTIGKERRDGSSSWSVSFNTKTGEIYYWAETRVTTGSGCFVSQNGDSLIPAKGNISKYIVMVNDALDFARSGNLLCEHDIQYIANRARQIVQGLN